ncbi:TPA: hypothetical protein DDW35_09355 [Candidatus Sumerlaeota bacterium]|nr:hypothetical protein [Candidatus Sumerlaeota bacterium]
MGYADNERGTQTISQCYATGDVSGSSDYVGGLVGNAYSSDGTQTISQCFATGDVSGSTRVGGLVGYAYNYGGTQMISQSYASGAVSGTSYLGGLVGSAYSGSGTQTFTACYCLTGHGAVNSGTKTGISVVSTSALRTQSTFSGWDFSDDWVIDTTQGFNDGYPYLRAFSALVYSLNINDGATSTTSRTVTLTPVMSPFTTHYAVSENADFSDASWIALDDATTMTYTLSSGVGEKMLYFATYNNNNSYFDNSDDDLSEITTATITLAGITPTVTAFTINSGAASATSAAVTFQNAATGDPTYYKVSDVADLTTATWTAYSTSGNFTLTGANDSKTLYFQVKNDFAESAIVSASINLLAADMSFVKNSVTVQSAHSETYAAKTAVITSKDTYAFKASIQLPSTFASISASTQINITVGDVTFSQPLSAAVSSSLKGAKGGSAVFRTQVLVGKTKKTTQIVTLTWSKAGLLKVVVTGTPVAETGSKVTTNILNALSTDDGSVAANVPIAVGIGSDYARNETGVVCTGTRSTSTVKNTSVSLNKWVMTGKK